MTTVRTNVLCLIFIAITIAVAAYLYPTLPEQIPTHWNIEGEVVYSYVLYRKVEGFEEETPDSD
jgi:uncharacterized membrane protein